MDFAQSVWAGLFYAPVSTALVIAEVNHGGSRTGLFNHRPVMDQNLNLLDPPVAGGDIESGWAHGSIPLLRADNFQNRVPLSSGGYFTPRPLTFDTFYGLPIPKWARVGTERQMLESLIYTIVLNA